MLEIFKLVGRVMVDSSDADQSLDATGKKAEDTTGAIGEYAQKLQNWAAGLLTVSSVVAGLKKVWEVSSQVAELGDTIDKSSQKFLLSRAAYQEWAFVAEHSGFSIEQLGNAVVDLAKKVGEGSDDTNAALEELGISIADAATATPEDLFDMVITALQQMDNSTRKAYIADRLLGGAAKDLGPLLEANADDTQKLKDRMYELGGAMSDTLIDKSAEYEDALTNVKTAWQGIKNTLGNTFLIPMTKILDGLTTTLTGDVPEGLGKTAEGVAEFATGLLVTFGNFATSIVKGVFDTGKTLAATTFDIFKLYFTDNSENTNSADLNSFFAQASGAEPVTAPPPMAKLLAMRDEFTAAGGSEFAYIQQVSELYGAEVADALIETLNQAQEDVADDTETYSTAITGAAAAWTQATQDYAEANRNAVGKINAAAEAFISGANGNSMIPNGIFTGMRHAHANGIPFVPRDNYPSQLHYGERVLTRQENEEYSRGEGKGGDTTINIQTVAQSPAQTAAAITAALARARWAM